MSLAIIRGDVISAPAPGRLDVTKRGFLVAEDGVIDGVYRELPERFAGAAVEDYGQALVLQAPCDLHLHAPQYPMLGTGMDLPLLDWLNTYTFPQEARFADNSYAREACRRLARDLIENGTTRVCAFSSLHREASLILLEELERAGVAGYAGKVNMDRNAAPGVLEESTEESMTETLRFLEEAEGFSRVRPILTPRFTPSCTDGLMAFLGKLSAERGLAVQSHLSENRAEIAWVRELHPDCERYWETYAKYGLWHGKTLMAHCVWSDETERRAMADAGVTAVHCPASNQNICSGVAPVRRLLDEGVKVALGSDVAGGDKLSMFDAAADAVRASKTRRVMDNWETPFLTVAEAWYLATSGGAAFFGDKPGFAKGNPLHALVLSDGALPGPLTPEERLERCVYVRQREAIRAVWSAGRKVLARQEA